MLIDMPSALIVIVPLVFFLIVSKSGSVIGRYMKASFTKDHAYTGPELAGLSAAIRNTIKFLIGIGVFGFLIGLLGTLVVLNRPDMLGPNIAVSLITVLYSITLSYFVFFPTQAWAENKLNALKGDAEER